MSPLLSTFLRGFNGMYVLSGKGRSKLPGTW